MMIRLHARHNHMDQARGLFFEMLEWRYGYHILRYHLSFSHLHFSCVLIFTYYRNFLNLTKSNFPECSFISTLLFSLWLLYSIKNYYMEFQ